MEIEIDDEEGTDVPRQSLLDVVLEHKQKQSSQARLEDRITLLAKTKDMREDDEEIRDYFLDLFDLAAPLPRVHTHHTRSAGSVTVISASMRMMLH